MNEQLGQPCAQPGPSMKCCTSSWRRLSEQIGERAPALRRIEDVVLLDALPGQGAARAGDLVAQVDELLLARQQRLALGDPEVCGDDGMVRGGRDGFDDGGHDGSPWIDCGSLSGNGRAARSLPLRVAIHIGGILSNLGSAGSRGSQAWPRTAYVTACGVYRLGSSRLAACTVNTSGIAANVM